MSGTIWIAALLLRGLCPQSVALESAIYRYHSRSGALPTRTLIEALSQGVAAGRLEIIRSEPVGPADLQRERAQLEAARAGVVNQVQTVMAGASRSVPREMPMSPHLESPAPAVVLPTFDFERFRECSRTTLQFIKVGLQQRQPGRMLEAALIHRGDGAGSSTNGLLCGEYLGPLGGRVSDLRENIKLLMALSLEAPTPTSLLWHSFLAARHPNSPVVLDERRCMEIWLWKLAYERVIVGSTFQPTPSVLAAASLHECVSFEQYSGRGQRAHVARVLHPFWPTSVGRFAMERMRAAGLRVD